MEPKGPAAYISEFVGTFFLVLGICGVISAGAGHALLTNIALVHTLVLMSLVYAIGSISGCHVNPAVTLALLTIRKISGRDAAIYIVCQLAGAVLRRPGRARVLQASPAQSSTTGRRRSPTPTCTAAARSSR